MLMYMAVVLVVHLVQNQLMCSISAAWLCMCRPVILQIRTSASLCLHTSWDTGTNSGPESARAVVYVPGDAHETQLSVQTEMKSTLADDTPAVRPTTALDSKLHHSFTHMHKP